MRDVIAAMAGLVAVGAPGVLVRVARALGSTPRDAGAAMLVTPGATVGTVGGGALEQLGIAAARNWLAGAGDLGALAVPLGPGIGQCCGGHVTLALAPVDVGLLQAVEAEEAARIAALPAVLVFGAGHTGQALARALQPLPLALRVVDTRAEALAGLPPGVARDLTALPEAVVRAAAPGAAYLVMTHDHALDFLIAEAALARGDAAYVGMIGSATKRETFRRYLAGRVRIDALTLPIGGAGLRDKRPEVIAALTAAELVRVLLVQAEAPPMIAATPQKGRHARAS